jgi:hypothetical protein
VTPDADRRTRPGAVEPSEPRPANLSAAALFQKTAPAVVCILAKDRKGNTIGLGSGFYVQTGGVLITNYHVIEGAVTAEVIAGSGERRTVLGALATNIRADLVLLKVDGRHAPVLTLAPKRLPQVGTKVYAIGNPKGLRNTLSDGIVSGLPSLRSIQYIQTTAPISPGSSGGPLLTADGLVVGVVTQYRRGGQNLNFAVPAERIRTLLAEQHELRALKAISGKRAGKAPAEHLEQADKAIGKGDYPQAIQILAQLADRHPNDPLVQFRLGGTHVAAAGQLRWHRQKGLALRKEGKEYRFRGLSCEQMADEADAHFDKAYESYRAAYQLDPDGEIGRQADLKMYQLRTR